MSTPFDPYHGSIEVSVVVDGPVGSAAVRAGLDTGAQRTVLNLRALISAGYDPAMAVRYLWMTSASGTAYVPVFLVSRLRALGIERTNIEVIGHTLPPTASIEGLLGLDFFRGQVLNIDFRVGLIEVT